MKDNSREESKKVRRECLKVHRDLQKLIPKLPGIKVHGKTVYGFQMMSEVLRGIAEYGT